MKKTLAILAAGILGWGVVHAEDSGVMWDSSFNGTVSNTTIKLTDLNKAVDEEIIVQQETKGESSSSIENISMFGSTLDINTTDFSPVNGFYFFGVCTMNFDVLLTVVEPETGFAVGDYFSEYSGMSALTINVGASAAAGIAWSPQSSTQGASTVYTHDLLDCYYFSLDEELGTMALTIGGLGVNEKVGKYTNRGYVESLSELGDDEIALMAVTSQTPGWNDGDKLWSGYKLVLVARSAVAPVITEDDFAPEPTTGTLALLGLAGLCARRRRK